VNKERGEVTLATIGTARCLVIATTFGPVKGFDVITGSLYVTAIWEKLQEAARATGARHIGHAAHDILRIESGIPAVGFDVDEDTTPIEINQITQVDFTKRVFIGRRALMHSTAGETSRSLVSLKFDRHGAHPGRRGNPLRDHPRRPHHQRGAKSLLSQRHRPRLHQQLQGCDWHAAQCAQRGRAVECVRGDA
jgi:glycine cleavage system aminomethyltransferase T